MLCHVLVTWAICWLGKYYFPLGFLIVGYFLWVDSACCEPRWLKLTPTIGVVLAAIVNDEIHWPIHLLGVLLMAIAVVSNVAYESYLDYANTMYSRVLVILAMFFVNLSMFLKAFAVMESPWDWRCWKRSILEERKQTMDKCMRINYHGEGTKAQLIIYKVTGVCQWVALTLLINTY